jgi:hypothetical protein
LKIKQTENKSDSTIDNFYSNIFKNKKIYECFIEYTQKHIIEFYTDYSYLKKRLEKHKFIHRHTDNDFIDFLKDDIKLISEKDFDNYIKNDSKLKSLDKSFSVSRENNFNNIFNDLLSP